MNERIKELAKQAGLKVDADGEIRHDFFGSVDAGYKKFAELIVQECYSICEDIGDKGLDGHYCADEIKRTFGVE
mgnify:CR=1 FL=1